MVPSTLQTLSQQRDTVCFDRFCKCACVCGRGRAILERETRLGQGPPVVTCGAVQKAGLSSVLLAGARVGLTPAWVTGGGLVGVRTSGGSGLGGCVCVRARMQDFSASVSDRQWHSSPKQTCGGAYPDRSTLCTWELGLPAMSMPMCKTQSPPISGLLHNRRQSAQSPETSLLVSGLQDHRHLFVTKNGTRRRQWTVHRPGKRRH